MFEHQALLYGTDQEFLDTVAPFLAEGREHPDAMLAATTSANIELLRDHLGSDAERVEFVEREALLTAPGPTLQAFEAFLNAKLEAGAPWVRILGEPIWAGRSDSEIGLWMRFESLFNLVFAASPMTLLCPYDKRSVPPEIVRQARFTHPHTIGQGGIASNPEYADPAGFVLDH
jgi:hypothetical protein